MAKRERGDEGREAERSWQWGAGRGEREAGTDVRRLTLTDRVTEVTAYNA